MRLVIDLQAQKLAARARLKQCAAALSAVERGAAALRICARILNADFFERARTVMLYAPTPGEVDISVLVQCCGVLGKRICLPRIDWKSGSMSAALLEGPGKGPGVLASLVAGKHGIREPRAGAPVVPVGEIDLVIVPGVGFDAAGNRIGRGAGYYDRFLGQKNLRAVRCGVAFGAQVVHAVPHGTGDVPVHAVATEDALLTPGKAAA